MEKIAKFIQNLINRYFPGNVDSVIADLEKAAARLEEIEDANIAVRNQNAMLMERIVQDNFDRMVEENRAVIIRDSVIDAIEDTVR